MQLLECVREIYNMLSVPKPTSLPHPQPPIAITTPGASPGARIIPPPNVISKSVPGTHAEAFTAMACTAALDVSHDNTFEDFFADPEDIHFKPPTPASAQFQLPLRLQAINKARQITGSNEFQKFRAKYKAAEPPPRPSFLNHKVPSLQELRQGIDYVFRPDHTSPTAGLKCTDAEEERKKEIIIWKNGLSHFLGYWISPLTEPLGNRQELNTNQESTPNNLVELLVHLNHSIESSDNKTKRVFYEAIAHSRFDQTLEKLCTVTKSVRCMKEIEEFEDVRDEWGARHQ
jgi:hypothetical protein